MLANKTTICNLTNGTKVATGVATDLGKMVMAVERTKNSKATHKRPRRTAHAQQAGVASGDEDEDIFFDMTVSQPVTAAEDLTASQDTTSKPSASSKKANPLSNFFKPTTQPTGGKDKNAVATPTSPTAAPSSSEEPANQAQPTKAADMDTEVNADEAAQPQPRHLDQGW
jgi:hypothetical protein